MSNSPRSSIRLGDWRAIVVGFGSIGRRHTEILNELGCDTAVVSRRAIDAARSIATIQAAVEEHRPHYVVVANETAAHRDSLEALAHAGFEGHLLVEKPLFGRFRTIPENRFASLSVAYNLRFHPGLQRLRDLLQDDAPVSAFIYVGQYLPSWRPAEDYRRSYSASRVLGGGALRDLSHDLDYACWLLGRWRGVAALGGHYSDLDITSDDIFALLLETERCPVSTVQMNYLDRQARRMIVINGRKHTYTLDLISHTLEIDGLREIFEVERNTTYRAMHLAILSGDSSTICCASEALDVLRLIDAAEQAEQQRTWVAK